MDNYTITETVTLPSKGKVYATEVASTVTLRSMTTQDEMVRLSPSDTPFKAMCDLIDGCMVSNPGISSYDMCLGDYLFLLHKLRTITYGSTYSMGSTCPYCSSQHSEDINLDELKIIEYTDEAEQYKTFTLPVTNKVVSLRYQTPRMLDDLQAQEKEFKQKHKDVTTDFSLVHTLVAIIETIDGRYYDVVKMEEWVKKLPMKDTNTILQYAAKLNTTVGVDTTVTQLCPVCDLDYQVKMRADAEFFRPALNIGW